MADQVGQVLIELGAVAILLAPIVTGIVAGIKLAAKNRVPDAYWPAVSVGTGILLALLIGWYLAYDARLMLLAGGLAGLGASGLYTYGSAANALIRKD